MKKDNDNKQNSDWKQAADICLRLDHLDKASAIKAINLLTLDEGVRKKVFAILNRVGENNTVLDDDYSSLMDSARNNDDKMIGKIIDTYRILSFIAKGGMSSIYKAENIQAGVQKAVALKILSPYVFSDKSVELFNREQLILSRLEHPNIISFHHSGKTKDNTRYLIMEYIEGAQTITDYCQNKNFNTKQIVQYVHKLAQVFTYAHDNLIIHRDIKPSNLLIDQHGHIKVIDFGIGQIISENDSTSTQVFTLDTASPEQILGQSVNKQSDVFSLGVILLQLLVKKSPLPKTNIASYNPQDDVKHINKLLVESQLDKDLQNIIKTAAHIDKEKRYASMKLFAQDLHNWLEKRPISASSDSLYYRIGKFYLRNKAVSLAVTTAMLVITISIFVINYTNRISAKTRLQKENSIAIIEALFNQADPFNSGVKNDQINLALQQLNVVHEELLNSDPELKYFILNKISDMYRNNRNYQRTLQVKEQALKALLEFTNKFDNRYTVLELEILNLLLKSGEYTKVINRTKEFKNKISNYPDIKPTFIFESSFILLKSYRHLNQYENAKEIQDSMEDMLNQPIEINTAMKALFLNSSAVHKDKSGDLQGAYYLYLQSINLFNNRNIDINVHDKFLIKSNYANLLVKMGYYEDAENLFLELFNLRKNIEGQHPQFALIKHQYSQLLYLTNRLNLAQKLSYESIEILKPTNSMRSLAWVHGRMAKIAIFQNNIELAMEHSLEALKINMGLYGLDNNHTIVQLNYILWILLQSEHPKYIENFVAFLEQSPIKKHAENPIYRYYSTQKNYFENRLKNTDQGQSLIQYLSIYDNLNKTNQNNKIFDDMIHGWLITFFSDGLKRRNLCTIIDGWRPYYNNPSNQSELCNNTYLQYNAEINLQITAMKRFFNKRPKQNDGLFKKFFDNVMTVISPAT